MIFNFAKLVENLEKSSDNQLKIISIEAELCGKNSVNTIFKAEANKEAHIL